MSDPKDKKELSDEQLAAASGGALTPQEIESAKVKKTAPKPVKELNDEQLDAARGGASDVQSSEMSPIPGEERDRGFERPPQ